MTLIRSAVPRKRSIGGLDSFGGGLNELGYVIGMGDHRQVAGRDFDGNGPMRLANCRSASGGIA
jgi:hypothetical protein